MDDIAARLERWTVDAAQLVGDVSVSVSVSVPLRLPCLVCGARFADRQKAGETGCTDGLHTGKRARR